MRNLVNRLVSECSFGRPDSLADNALDDGMLVLALSDLVSDEKFAVHFKLANDPVMLWIQKHPAAFYRNAPCFFGIFIQRLEIFELQPDKLLPVIVVRL